MVPEDAAAVYEERALHDAVSVCGLFNLMNRLVEGLGVTVEHGYFATSARRLADIGYVGLKQML